MWFESYGAAAPSAPAQAELLVTLVAPDGWCHTVDSADHTSRPTAATFHPLGSLANACLWPQFTNDLSEAVAKYHRGRPGKYPGRVISDAIELLASGKDSTGNDVSGRNYMRHTAWPLLLAAIAYHIDLGGYRAREDAVLSINFALTADLIRARTASFTHDSYADINTLLAALVSHAMLSTSSWW